MVVMEMHMVAMSELAHGLLTVGYEGFCMTMARLNELTFWPYMTETVRNF